MNTSLKSVASGFAGAVAPNLWYETSRQLVPEALRADIQSERLYQKING